MVARLAEDPIPNIRFNVAKALEALTPLLKGSNDTVPLVDNEVKPILKHLVEDQDVDVRFFAQRAITQNTLQ